MIRTINNKTNTFNNESKSVDFQVTYIERKQDSFYRKGNMTNQTNFLRSGNITDVNIQALRNTKFLNENEKSDLREEKVIMNDLLGREQRVIDTIHSN